MESLRLLRKVKRIQELAQETGKLGEKQEREKITNSQVDKDWANIQEMRNEKDKLVKTITKKYPGIPVENIHEIWKLAKRKGELEEKQQQGKTKHKGRWIWKEIRDHKKYVEEKIDNIA